MKLGEKIRYLRYAEGMLRGSGRAMTQAEVLRAVREEMGKSISQSYLSQIEKGARPHLTRTSRELLARFFKVHPGFLVDDPEGYQTELISGLPAPESGLHLWLLEGAQRFRRDAEVSAVLEKLAQRDDTKRCLALLGAILDSPDLVPKLLHVLRPGHDERPKEQNGSGSSRAHGSHGSSGSGAAESARVPSGANKRTHVDGR
ncbi:MAG: helix-turn-helix transcriptional regulator [Candidatus Acidiferrales bacterium]